MGDQNHGHGAQLREAEAEAVRSRDGVIGDSPAEPTFRFAPLGITTSIIADDSALLDAAIVGFAGFGRSADRADPKVAIRLRWNELATAKVGFTVAVKGSWLTIAGDGVLGRADASTGVAECSLSRAYGGDAGMLAEIGETLLLFLLTRLGRAPVHAAAVMIGETALVLAGPSGAGKSSLALAAQRDGLEVLSEDTVYVQLEPELRVWGWPGAIHLSPDDAPGGQFARRLRGGRVKLAIPRSMSREFATRAALVGIERGAPLGIERAEAVRLVARLAPREPGFVLLRPQVERALRALARGGAWRMTLSRSADDAVELLRERFGQAGR